MNLSFSLSISHLSYLSYLEIATRQLAGQPRFPPKAGLRGADGESRTPSLTLRTGLLYPLSYIGTQAHKDRVCSLPAGRQVSN